MNEKGDSLFLAFLAVPEPWEPLEVAESAQPAEFGGGVKRLSTCQTCQDGHCRGPLSPEGDGKVRVSCQPLCSAGRALSTWAQVVAEQLRAMKKNRVDECV